MSDETGMVPIGDLRPTTEETRNERAMAAVRLVAALLTILNFALVQFGWDPLNIDNDVVYVLVAAALDVLATIWSWWNNNNVTRAAQTGQNLTDAIKRGE